MPVRPGTAAPAPGRLRSVLSAATTVVAAIVVFGSLLLPKLVEQVTPLMLLRIPVEALVGAVVLLVTPKRARGVVALLGGAVLGVLTVLKLVDMGFQEVLARPFDPVLDWGRFGDAEGYLVETIGRPGTIGIAVGLSVLVLVLVVGMAFAVRRLARPIEGHRLALTGTVAVLGTAWVACFAVGAQLVAPLPLASRGTAALALQQAEAVPASLHDQEEFQKEAAVDAYRNVPAAKRLGGLAGKDFLLTFVESYGRSAVEDPRYAPVVDATLDQGTKDLATAGFTARSGWLTSPIAGGGSWYAHSTLQSGLLVDNEQRYRSLVSSDRLTLTGAFHAAGTRTVGVMPGLTKAWPEGNFYGYDKVYDGQAMGYRGLNFSWSPMPDQYALAEYERTEYGTPGRKPIMSDIALTSSHMPWTPVPQLVDWNAIGDGTGYNATALAADSPDIVWKDPDRVRAGYRDSIAYSVNSLISWLKTYGDDNTVMVFLGDHQPAPIVTGPDASHDVPITIVAKDPKVLDRVASWGWAPGLRPAASSPVWPMSAFRDHFFGAFGTRPGDNGPLTR